MSGPCAIGDSQYAVTYVEGGYDTYCLGPTAAAAWVPGYVIIPGKTVASKTLVPNDYNYSAGGVNDSRNPNAGLQAQWLNSSGVAQSSNFTAGYTPSGPFDGTPLASTTFLGQPLWVFLVIGLAVVILIVLGIVAVK